MSTEAYKVTSVPFEGKRLRGVIITCGRDTCGVTKTIPINSFATHDDDTDGKEERFVQKKCEHDGWLFAKKPGGHRCPACFAAIKVAAKRKAEMSKMTLVKSNVPPPAPKPRQLTREDRRIIFDTININYGDEKTGYKAGWNDAKVAADLAVPLKWVGDIREEMFGPEFNAERAEALATLAVLPEQIATASRIITNTMTELAALVARAEQLTKDFK